MAQLSVQTIVRTGLNPTMVAAGGSGDQFANTPGRTMLFVKVSGSSVTVTIDIQKTFAGQPVTDPTVLVPDGEERMIGPFDGAWEDSSDNVRFTYDAGLSNATVAAVKI